MLHGKNDDFPCCAVCMAGDFIITNMVVSYYIMKNHIENMVAMGYNE